MNKRHLPELPPTTAVVVLVPIVLGFVAVVLFALGQQAGGISVSILGGVAVAVVAILGAIGRMLPPGRGDTNTESGPPPATGQKPAPEPSPIAARPLGSAPASGAPASPAPIHTEPGPDDMDLTHSTGTASPSGDPGEPAGDQPDPAALTP